MAPEILPWLAWALPYAGAILALALRRLGRIRDYVAVAFLLLSALASTPLPLMVGEEPLVLSYPWVPGLNISASLLLDGLSATMAFIVAWLSFLIGFYSLKYMEGDPWLTWYWFFFDFFVGSMMLAVLADNLFLMFIGWEGTGLSSYALIGHWLRDEEDKWVGDPGRVVAGVPMAFSPTHSGLRAIAFTRVGDVGFLAAIGILFVLTGNASFSALASSTEWASTLAASGMLLPFLILFTLGPMAKSAQFPFHEWLVTAMTGPTSVSALIHAATMVKVGVYMMLRFSPIVLSAAAGHPAIVSQYFTFVLLIGALTAFALGTMALVSRELKMILAYSTASQLGYMFAAVGSMGLAPEPALGFTAGIGHLASHAVFKASLFLAAGAIIHAVHSRFIDDMGGLATRMKLTFIAMLVAALSLSGVPGLMGFWTKDMVLEAVGETGVTIAHVLLLTGALVTAFYSIRMVAKVFLGRPGEGAGHAHEAHVVMLAPYLLLALATLALGLAWPLVYGGFAALVSKTLALHGEPPLLHLDPAATAVSISLVGTGLALATLLYIRPGVDTVSLLGRSRLLGALWGFLYDRWYVNVLVYRGLVYPFAAASRLVFRHFDTGVIDRAYHAGIPGLFTRLSTGLFRTLETRGIDHVLNVLTVKATLAFSGVVRRIQTGLLNHYILLILTGLAALLAYIIWVM